ncbi:MAG: ATP-binding cassette domain-containing protein [Verrucomicrobia bacterium]|nr:ATP-binding cassette domain-containing protein [Verrucomicrobiota bacterium]MBV8376320.1 ATP-binding cassette domain-containing protein [Verrucomicrobiota bacterium]
MAIISIHDLRVVRGGIEILKGIHWEVAAKENWVILGPNGSGKTTLLSCVTGYVTPSAGTIEVLGKKYGQSDWRELRKEVGLVSSGIRHWIEDQQTALDVVASGRNAELNLWHPAAGALLREARKSLRQVECANLGNRPWAFLSQGERQRVLIGRALMARYRSLILDEPCAGLDPVARERFLQFLSRLASSAKTPNLVFVTHHVEEILPCFDRALLLRAGEILLQGPIGKVITSKTMSQAFTAAITVLKREGRFQLRFRQE